MEGREGEKWKKLGRTNTTKAEMDGEEWLIDDRISGNV